MTVRSRIILALAGLMLVVMYVAPLWRIELEAPQYPEGLGLHIMIDDIQGISEFDLMKINQLNHYIGMQKIVPDAIPELKIMPWLIAGLIALALLASITGSRKLFTLWVSVFMLILLVGLVDFWLWEYDYGHNLDLETAAIKVPGMSYQPPLIGSKQLLNFRAISWPALGGWIAVLSCLTGMIMWWRTRPARTPKSSKSPVVAAALLALTITACTPGPEEFHFGDDIGAHCRMPIMDARFASQVVLDTGKVVKFDSIECLTGWLAAQNGPEIHSIWVSDGLGSETLIPAQQAVFVQHDAIRSPMGGGLIAFASESDARTALPDVDALTLRSWEDIKSRS
jgi:copper chaperone NosL